MKSRIVKLFKVYSFCCVRLLPCKIISIFQKIQTFIQLLLVLVVLVVLLVLVVLVHLGPLAFLAFLAFLVVVLVRGTLLVLACLASLMAPNLLDKNEQLQYSIKFNKSFE